MRAACAPVAFFAFNRPVHAARALAALAANPEAADTDLHIFLDGPRNEADAALVAEVERIARSTRGFRNIDIVASPANKGLYASITDGVGRIVADAGRVIVVEDDIVASPHFLRYMNDGLERYADDARVGSIHAYSPPVAGLPDFFFLRGGDCWGWATWADRWSLFRSDAGALLREIVASGQLDEFSKNHGIGSLLLLLRRARGDNQSWAILWHASLFLAGRLTLHPGASFADNIGNDGSGEHAADSTFHATAMIERFDGLPSDLPVSENTVAARALGAFLDRLAVGRRAGKAGLFALSLYAKSLARAWR